MAKRKARRKASASAAKKSGERPACGLCGKSGKLTRTPCCGRWICDDEDRYVLFSFARNSCSRNHRRYTLCGLHHEEGHAGDWKTCPECRKDIETELYVYYGTNEYNFEKLENPPDYEPTRCCRCGAVIHLGQSSYSVHKGAYRCGECTAARFPELFDASRGRRPRR